MFTLPQLPYAYDALEPYIDAQTMQIHHTKHHQTYVDKLNEALANHSDLQQLSVVDLLKQLSTLPSEIQTSVRNHGGGHFNHSLFWNLMCSATQSVQTAPSVELESMINSTFTSLEKMKELFATEATKRFGSGWAWLSLNESNQLVIHSTANQDSPFLENLTPVLGLDVWEHAYYLKYQNRRPDYIKNWWNVLNWTAVNEQFENYSKK